MDVLYGIDTQGKIESYTIPDLYCNFFNENTNKKDEKKLSRGHSSSIDETFLKSFPELRCVMGLPVRLSKSRSNKSSSYEGQGK